MEIRTFSPTFCLCLATFPDQRSKLIPFSLSPNHFSSFFLGFSFSFFFICEPFDRFLLSLQQLNINFATKYSSYFYSHLAHSYKVFFHKPFFFYLLVTITYLVIILFYTIGDDISKILPNKNCKISTSKKEKRQNHACITLPEWISFKKTCKISDEN